MQRDAGHRGDGAGSKEYPLHRLAPRVKKDGEIENGPDKKKPAQVDVFANVPFGVVGQLRKYPRRKEQQRQRLLHLVVEQDPSGQRGHRPQQNGGRPMLLDVEDLAHQRDGSAGGDSADRVQRGREATESLPRDSAAQVKDGHHRHHQGITPAGTQLIPVG